MRCILVIGREEDPCCRFVLQRLERMGRETLWLPEDRLFPGMDFAWKVWQDGAGGSVRYGQKRATFDALDGVFARFYGIPVTTETYQTKDGQYISSEWNALALAWMSSLACPVVNRLKPELWYKTLLNLPSLMALIPPPNLRLPHTMITTRFEDARAFYLRCDRRARYVPLTQPVVYSLETEEDLNRLEKLMGTLPFQLIERVDGQPAEAFVVNDEVTFTAPDGTRIVEAPPTAADTCREISEALGLAFCQISLVLDGEKKAWLMGANRMPQIYSLDPGVQEEISGHLSELLIGGERRSRT